MINQNIVSNIKIPQQVIVSKSIELGTPAKDAILGSLEFKETKNNTNIIKKTIKKGTTPKLIGGKKIKKPVNIMFAQTKEKLEEKWSQKYKNSIDCKNPKGFSQKAYCQGKKKKEVSELFIFTPEKLKGGKSSGKTFEDLVRKNLKHGTPYGEVESKLKKQLNKGIKVELEHTNNKSIAKEIALDHLFEDPKYYDKLKKIEGKEATGSGAAGGFVGPVGFDPNSGFVKRSFKEKPKKVETKEATGSGSSGSYVTPAAWAKSMNKKDWRGKSKTQIPGGQFVQVKKKCKTFPYCNQGDIKALKLSEQKNVLDNIIKKMSYKYNISENEVIKILKNSSKLIK